MPLGIDHIRGHLAVREASGAPYVGAKFTLSTGDTTLPDATPGQAGNITLIPASECPKNMRPYVTRVDISVNGQVNWSSTAPTAGSVPGLSLQDTAGVPVVVIPYCALKAGASYFLPAGDSPIPLLLGPATVNAAAGTPIDTFTYVESTGVITMAHTGAVANYGIGSPIQVLDGTGAGQAAFVTAITATTITVVPAFTGLGASSVIGMAYQTLQTYTSTAAVVLWAGGATPYNANSLDGYGLLGILPNAVPNTVAGLGKPITAMSTAGACTIAPVLNAAFTQATTLVQITDQPWLCGVVDVCVDAKTATLTINSGLQLVVNHYAGTAPVGSSVRVHVEGYWAY